MRIYIPSRGRSGSVATGTLSKIPESIMHNVVLAVHSGEIDAYMKRVPDSWIESGLHVRGFDYSGGIAEKRLQMGQHARVDRCHHFMMIDDDVDFLVRRSESDFRLRPQTSDETIEMFTYISSLMTHQNFSHVGVSGREGNNRAGNGPRSTLLMVNTRAMRMVCWNTDDFLAAEHCRVMVMEDFDVSLQALRRGRGNAVTYWYANGQKMTNAPGGCSLWRTHAVHEESARRLAELHPGLVSLRTKSNKTDRGGFGTRTEVTVQWKRALGHD